MLKRFAAPFLGTAFLVATFAGAMAADKPTMGIVVKIGGIPWFKAQGAEFLATGLAAMPSLHVASSAVFVYFAWVYERHLSWFYVPLFVFILIEAVATRWHYLVDIVAGLGLTALAILVVEFSFRRWLPEPLGNAHPAL